MLNSPDLSSLQRCGGSIISDKHVLTSASCVAGDGTYYVHLGDTILGNDKDVSFKKTTLVTNKYLHPDYDFSSTGAENDIAILEMAEPIALDQHGNIKPVCLPDQGAEFIGYTATVTGWDDNIHQPLDENDDDIHNSWLHEVDITILDDEECDNDYYIYYYNNYEYGVLSSQLCAGVLDGNEASCFGDDGGPLVVSDPNINNNGLTIAGIVDASDCNLVEAYTKVSVFSDWINGIIGDATTCPPPPSTIPTGCNNCNFPFTFGDGTFDTCIIVMDVDTQPWCSYYSTETAISTPIKITCSDSDSSCPNLPSQTLITSPNYPQSYPNNVDEVKCINRNYTCDTNL